MIGVPEELTELKAQVRAINSALLSRSACYYCADVATCEDHVIPHSLLHNRGTRRTGWEVDTLPSCKECNQLLSSHVTDTLKERKEHLADKVRRRYSKHLGKAFWISEELEHLAPGLRGMAEEFNAVKEQAERRLANLLDVPFVPFALVEIVRDDGRRELIYKEPKVRKGRPAISTRRDGKQYVPRVTKNRPYLVNSTPYRSISYCAKEDRENTSIKL